MVSPKFEHYLLDLMSVTPRDANYTGPNSKFCILIPEVIIAFCKDEIVDKTAVEESGSKHADDANKSEDIRFNPNVFTYFRLAGNPEALTVEVRVVLCIRLAMSVIGYLMAVMLVEALTQCHDTLAIAWAGMVVTWVVVDLDATIEKLKDKTAGAMEQLKEAEFEAKALCTMK